MKKIKKYIALKLVKFGIMIYESKPFGFLDDEDKSNLKKLWDTHDELTGVFK